MCKVCHFECCDDPVEQACGCNHCAEDACHELDL